jgi:hypothetical protein
MGLLMPKGRATEIDRFDGAFMLEHENPLHQPVSAMNGVEVVCLNVRSRVY